MKKLLEILTSRATKDEVVERILGNKKTSALAAVVIGCWGAAASLYDKGFVIAAALAAGAGGVVAIIGLLLAKDGEGPPPAAPQ